MDLLHMSEQGVQQAIGHSLSTASLFAVFLGLAVVVHVAPGALTHVAEVVAAGADHMVASLFLLDEHQAVGATLPILEVFLEVILTWTFVLGKQALFAELDVAFWTLEPVLFDVDDGPAVLGGA